MTFSSEHELPDAVTCETDFSSVVQVAHLCAALIINFGIKSVTGLMFNTIDQTLCIPAFGLYLLSGFLRR